MKTVAVILPVNNPNIVTQADLNPHNTNKIQFVLHYVHTDLKELNTLEQADSVLKLMLNKANQRSKAGDAAIIVYSFGEFGIAELTHLNIPIMALGTEAVKQASQKAENKFTIISGCLSHNDYWPALLESTQTSHNYVKTSTAPEISPAEIRKNQHLIKKLLTIAEHEITNQNVDSFTLGCGSFIGAAAPLQKKLREKYGNAITVIDPVTVTFEKLKREIA